METFLTDIGLTPQYFLHFTFLNELHSLTYAVVFLALFFLTGGLVPFLLATSTAFVISILINRFLWNRRASVPVHSAVMITGCSTGIGLSLGLDYAVNKGVVVFATVRKQADADNLLTMFKATPTTNDPLTPDLNKRGDLIPVIMDVDQLPSIEEAVVKVDEICITKKLTLITLINNAGMAISGQFELLSPQRLRDQYQTNVFGLIHVTNHVLPILRRAVVQLKAEHSRVVPSVINFGSIASTLSLTPLGAYTSSKYAVKSLSECLKHELQGMGINVVTICPGAVKTNFYSTLSKSQVINKTVTNTTITTSSTDNGLPDLTKQKSVAVSQERYIDLECPVEPSIQEYYNLWSKAHSEGTALVEKMAFSPDSIVRTVWDVVLSPRPHAHYHTGPDALLFAPVVKYLVKTGLFDLLGTKNRPKFPQADKKHD